MNTSLETELLLLIHNWTKGQAKQRWEVWVCVPPCYTSCELLEVRAPGFQGQLSGDSGCELMLMKAAQACKQHERMSLNTLQYITVSPGQDRRTWLSPDHPPTSYPQPHLPTHTSRGSLGPPEYPTSQSLQKQTGAEVMLARHTAGLLILEVQSLLE